MDVQDWQDQIYIREPMMNPAQVMQLSLMVELLEEIRGLRSDLAQANESDPDAEPDPFQTLNGPRL